MPILPETNIITFGNQKGGVGKTTSVVNVAAALAMNDANVMVIDADPQGNCSSILLKERELRETNSIVDALNATSESLPLSSRACRTFHPALKIIPNSSRCMLWEREVANTPQAVLGLRQLIENDQGLAKYDYILIDTPPTLGVMMNNALMASDFVIVPVPPSDQFALDGLVTFFNLIQNIRNRNNDLKLLGIVFTRYDQNWGASKKNLEKIETYFVQLKINVFQTRIHNCPEVDLAHMARLTLFETEEISVCAEEYSQLSEKISAMLRDVRQKATR